jgi:tetratricopeptide (TPR) repeat protein
MSGGGQVPADCLDPFQAGDYQTASDRCHARLRDDPGNGSLWHLLGLARLALGRPEDALESLTRAASLCPGQAAIHAYRGDVLRVLGNGAEAAQAYRAADAIEPGHARAANGLGLLAADGKRWDEALTWHDRALAAAPTFPEALNARGVALSALGLHDEALDCFGLAKSAWPGYADAAANEANTLRLMGRLAEASHGLDRAIAAGMATAEIFHARAGISTEMGRLEDALADCARALSSRPSFTPALTRQAEILIRLKRYDDAAKLLDRVLTVPSAPPSVRAEAYFLRGTAVVRQERVEDGDDILAADQVHFLRGATGLRLRRFEEALADLDRAIALRPDFPDAWTRRGDALFETGDFDDALASYDTALRHDPEHLDALNRRTSVLAALDRGPEAEITARRVLSIDPDNAGALNNFGNIARRLGRVREAVGLLERAIPRASNKASVRLNYAMALLHAGDYERGWPEYEARWSKFGRPSWADDPIRVPWTGVEPVAGRRLLLYAEQGLGDCIQFVRYVPMVVAKGATVLLHVPRQLMSLFQGIEGVTGLSERGSAPPLFDMHCALMSLPLAFRTRLDTIPDTVPYLTPPADRIGRWRARLGAKRGFRVGLAWSGNPDHQEDIARTIALAALAPLLNVASETICLQREVRPSDLPALARFPAMRFLGHELEDFSDTAAVIHELNLVISADTSVLHLAGAMGRPVWGLIPAAADWRWLHDRNDSPWYPTMRLFRQTGPGDWDGVIRAVHEALVEVTAR